MTNGRAPKSKELYTLTWLPWLLGLLVFGCYLVTVNRSISFVPDWSGLVPPPLQQPPLGARMTDWVFGAEFLAPVYYLVTLPLRLLPEQIIPVALNLQVIESDLSSSGISVTVAGVERKILPEGEKLMLQ